MFYYAKFMETDVFARALALTSGAFCSGTENRVRQNNAAAADPTNRARKRGGDVRRMGRSLAGLETC